MIKARLSTPKVPATRLLQSVVSLSTVASLRMNRTSLEPPEKPLPGDCCGSGCSPCVWETYYEGLERYNAAKAKAEAETKALNHARKTEPCTSSIQQK
ncbi:hypothetical protein CLOM_g3984 [Closterium sp. NIES-68]|nr:hypothetical protein CLOM_g17954 [Closterium sp. NIES-68]GJP44608.1 hypothetical protein CLOM_g3984 [Closterium sp. NIES-68]GJP83214.1 hypothetical protein CLOP_g13397 [Closterium sp. NIES-67]